MTMLHLQSIRKNEKGVALVFTLVMLSLLLILALAFALDSMFEQRAAYNSASASSSGFMGQAQLKQVLLLMQEGEANFDDNGMLYSHDSSATDDTDDMLTDKLPVAGVIEYDSGNANDPIKKVQWNYVKNAEGKIVGRTAFIVVPEDKIPLDSLVDERVGSSAYPKHDEKNDTETRIGKYVSEINVRGAIPAVTNNISTITEKLNWFTGSPISGAGFANGKYTGSWTSFNNLYTTIGITDDDDKTEFESNLTLTTVKDEEAFWTDLNGDSKMNSDEIYKRFDLTRSDWTTADNAADVTFIKDKILLTTGTTPDVDMEKWTNTASDASSVGLPWLACFGYKSDGTEDEGLKGNFANVKDRRFQIAANLKDYSDTDNRPTTDVDPSTWSTFGTTGPTYTGNEKTPYINKVGMKFDVSQYDSDDGGSYTVGASVTMSPCVELINIYGSGCSDNLTVAIEGTVTIKTTITGSSAYTAPPKSFSCTMNIASSKWTNPGYSQLIIDNSIGTFKTGEKTGITGSRHVDLEITQINFTKVALVNMSDGYDYAKNLLQDYSTPPITAHLNSGAGSQYMWYGFAANDPRQNLFRADWKHLTPLATNNASLVFSFTNTSDPYNGASNAENSTTGGGGDDTEAPTTGPDLETVTNPANGNLSTAYIRNAPMESPWELGFIHRGAKWETLNLKAYDKTKAFQLSTINGKNYIPGGGAYASGDANILDQVKMTSSAESPQKINMSSQENHTFDALFYKVKLGCGIDSTMTVASLAGLAATPTGTAIDLTASSYTADPTGLRKLIQTLFKSPDITNYTNLTRASVADILKTFTGGATDAAQEELIGKIINLTKVGAQSGDFAIIVLSQTINDIGGVGAAEITVYKTPADGSAALPVPCLIGRFDTKEGTDSDTWTDDAYGDEISGVQKIMLKGNSSANGTITIKSFQYID